MAIKNWYLIPLFIFISSCATLPQQPSFGYDNVLKVKSYSVLDGDTIHVVDNDNKSFKVRLTGIDAPESNQPSGNESTDSLISCLDRKNIVVNWSTEDKYGRILAKVIANNTDCNLQQIQKGYAWHYKYFQADQPTIDQQTYALEETTAKKKGLGIWQDPCPTPPWKWRKKQTETCEDK